MTAKGFKAVAQDRLSAQGQILLGHVLAHAAAAAGRNDQSEDLRGDDLWGNGLWAFGEWTF